MVKCDREPQLSTLSVYDGKNTLKLTADRTASA